MSHAAIRAFVVALLASAFGAAPAWGFHDEPELFYSVRSAEMSYSVDFDGAGAAGCAERGVCDVSGTAAYRFARLRTGFGFLSLGPRGRSEGEIFVLGRGRADVRSGAVTDPTPCTDRALHRFDGLSLAGRRGRVTLTFHPLEQNPIDYLDTLCTGPGDRTLARAGVFPSVTFPLRPFRSRVVRFSATGERPFAADGFRGTVRFSLRFVLRRERLGDGRRGPSFTG